MAGKAARIYDNMQVTHAIRRKFVAGTDFTNTNTAQTVALGVIPAGSMICGVSIRKDVAMDGAGATVTLGNTAAPAGIATSATVAPGSLGSVAGVLFPSLAADALTPGATTVNAVITPGTTPTVGTFEVTIEYYPFAT